MRLRSCKTSGEQCVLAWYIDLGASSLCSEGRNQWWPPAVGAPQRMSLKLSGALGEPCVDTSACSRKSMQVIEIEFGGYGQGDTKQGRSVRRLCLMTINNAYG